MKKCFLLSFCLIAINGLAQDDMLKAFDFWVGTWEATWRDANGNEVKGENVITKTCKDNVIYETFSDTTNQFFGTSISVFSPVDSLWHQAWADNQGGYIDLIGIVEEDVRIFQTKPISKGDKVIIRRMIFYNITPQSFTWDWEITQDGGETWQLAWQILYVRKA